MHRDRFRWSIPLKPVKSWIDVHLHVYEEIKRSIQELETMNIDTATDRQPRMTSLSISNKDRFHPIYQFRYAVQSQRPAINNDDTVTPNWLPQHVLELRRLKRGRHLPSSSPQKMGKLCRSVYIMQHLV